jgi:glycine cleavage system H protein
MNLFENNPSFGDIPSEEARCVWMTIGIISDLPCELEFECESCPIDQVVRNRTFKHTSENERKSIPQENKLDNLSLDRLYSLDHYWIKKIFTNYYRIGIEPALSSALIFPKTIVLPSCAQRVTSNQPCGWFISEGGTFPLFPPLDGRVIKVNRELYSYPQEFHKHPVEKSWLFEITTEDRHLSDYEFLTAGKAQSLYRNDMQSFRDSILTVAETQGIVVGRKMADGGIPMDNIAEIIGGEIYYKIVRDIFLRKGIRT